MLLDGCAAVTPFGRERIGKRQCLHTTSSYVVDFLKHGPKPKETRSTFFANILGRRQLKERVL
jgi:hypothetical protein